MAQADSNPTTNPMSNESIAAPAGLARRAFVAALAGGAAAAIVAPAASLASGEPDPIFEQIESHRTLQLEYDRACAEQSRREDILIEEGIGLCPFVVMVDGGRPIVVHSHPQIDAYGQGLSEQVRARAHTAMDAALERYEAVYGNIERKAGKIGDAALDSFEDLVGTVPTSVAGIRALLSYLSEDVDDLYKEFDDDKLKALLISIDDALQVIHPVV